MSTPAADATNPTPTFFLNLPTTSLPPATTFYTTLGFTPVPAWTSPTTAVFLLPAPNQHICLMLHTQACFQQFIRPGSAVADARATQQTLFSIGCRDREGVDAWLERVEGAGGKRDPYVMEGFGEGEGMYVRSWEDLDGHVWEGVCLLDGGGDGVEGKGE
ncbi:Glyoxalase/Bleomycin resistance protein/Dihydroxybiphenyl dioxygenase [Chaetomium tenue]|uniref:Glyoxalase/Bleomycin resistance protein/Dihydroxybiphenyl dioxygenase n=1 Tax=Chaetomium tenue TaxID=1854479 RepID=A0ACB7PFH8_9PEZI|nr:Glyoxalase/Bleomycin resistance protein/Dihydroxybiphenyl dioxygenase [Chaetomium globosum]